MKKFPLADVPTLFGPMFYTTAMVYDRREQAPFPPVNIYFCEDTVLVQALLPGLGPDNIRLSLDQNSLLLEGCIRRCKGYYIHEERYSGHFRRKIILKTAVFPCFRSSFSNGILEIELQKRK